MPAAPARAPRIQIENVRPLLDCGRYAIKRCAGDPVEVSATIFRDGHEVLRAAVRARPKSARSWLEAPMERIDAHLDGDTWAGEFAVDSMGPWEYVVQAWTDPWASWTREMERKIAVAQPDLSGELSEGVVHLEHALERAKRQADKRAMQRALDTLKDPTADQEDRCAAVLDDELIATVERLQAREETAASAPAPLWVDRERAAFGSWYELFPRSWGGFKGITKRIPEFEQLGFDILYLPPIHPIGKTNRKGKNNSLVAGSKDPGSPWAIGDESGGHDAIDPKLGSEADFRKLIGTAGEHGIEIALDLALQCSADHPWLKQHPEWFQHRPDGTLKYAENPPKKYQDIYNLDWDCADWRGLWEEVHRVVRHWVDMGVRVFRVDNPHTKPLPFWEWLIARIHATDPDVIFLAEAFTRAAMMKTLAKLGFSQSYTYFTWKNSRHELIEYVEELAHTEMAEYYRPNFFANTPDILSSYLVGGGPAAFTIRAVLAATLSPSYGIYSGFESFENVPVKPGSEEYLDSEKYELKKRKLDGELLPLLKGLNAARRANPALQRLQQITFLDTHNDGLIAYAKQRAGNTVIVVCSLDPQHGQEGVCIVPYELGLPPVYRVTDLLTGERFEWQLGRNYVRLEPPLRLAHVLRVDH